MMSRHFWIFVVLKIVEDHFLSNFMWYCMIERVDAIHESEERRGW